MKRVLSALAFVSIAMITGSIVSYAVNRSSVEVPDEAQERQAIFSCTVSGCTQTEVHMHGLCGINGCTLRSDGTISIILDVASLYTAARGM